jgi:hypothetical protein
VIFTFVDPTMIYRVLEQVFRKNVPVVLVTDPIPPQEVKEGKRFRRSRKEEGI